MRACCRCATSVAKRCEQYEHATGFAAIAFSIDDNDTADIDSKGDARELLCVPPRAACAISGDGIGDATGEPPARGESDSARIA
jgi:hypothetical protein